MLKRLLVLGFAGLLVLPLTMAHTPIPFPQPQVAPCPVETEHHYGVGASVSTYSPLAITWRTTVVLTDSCAQYDGEGDYGIGGGFLPMDHHNAYEGVCVFDVTGNPVSFWIGVTGPAGLIVASSPLLWTCGKAYDAFGNPLVPGPTDGGWWIFLAQGEYSHPVAGHICSAPLWDCF